MTGGLLAYNAHTSPPQWDSVGGGVTHHTLARKMNIDSHKGWVTVAGMQGDVIRVVNLIKSVTEACTSRGCMVSQSLPLSVGP